MNRQNFDKPTKIAVLNRARDEDGVPRCEFILDTGIRCRSTKQLEVHHNTKMDAMKSDADKAKIKLTVNDGLLLCKDHHNEETAIERVDLAKAVRVEARNLGVEKSKRGFARVSKKPGRESLRVANGIPRIAREWESRS